ncbi:hypothetical protein SK128_025182 [Halocaridina rubra]|uniref:MAM domain-containing protein n=1 Tax=Halocaridina rubra TaxID=373956 RepID=A0AAN8ZZ35_HALRR
MQTGWNWGLKARSSSYHSVVGLNLCLLFPKVSTLSIALLLSQLHSSIFKALLQSFCQYLDILTGNENKLQMLTYDDSGSKLLWERFGRISYLWTYDFVDLNITTQTTLGFMATYMSDDESGIFLDDFELLPHACPPNSATCNFDRDLCGWSNEVIVRDIWLVGHGYTLRPQYISGPLLDHTTRNGMYAYVDFTNMTSSSSRLMSEIMPKSANNCLSFWYVKYGKSGVSGTLTVRLVQLVPSSADNVTNILVLDNHVFALEWTRVMIDFQSPENKFQLLMDAKKSLLDQFIGIDDILVLPTKCDEIPPTPTPRPLFSNYETYADTQEVNLFIVLGTVLDILYKVVTAL